MTTPEMTVSDVAMPNGTPSERADSPRVSTRARARIPVADGSGKIVAVLGLVWSDWLNSWVLADSTTSLRAYLKAEKTRPVPGDNAVLRRGRIAWAYTGGSFFTLLGHTLAWLGQSPARLVVAAAVVGAPIVIWVTG